MTNKEMVTVAIYTYEKAIILKNILENEGIEVAVENVNKRQPLISSGVRICVSNLDLPKALRVIDDAVTLSAVAKRQNGSKKGFVLIPIDFSEYSIKACEVGFSYAWRWHLQVVVLHSYISQSYSGALPLGDAVKGKKIVADSKEKSALSLMSSFKETIKRDVESGKLPDVVYDCKVMEGIPETAILEFAKNTTPALIVMGTRGKHKKEQDLIGSVTAEVLDSVKYPMLVIPEGVTVTDICNMKNILFYCNLEQQDLLSLDVFMREFDGMNTSISLVHVPDKKEKMVSERMDEMVKYCNNQYRASNFSSHIFNENAFLEDFDKYLRDNEIEIVVIPNKKRNIFARLFNPSIAHRILFHTDIPMLVVPIK